MSKAKEIGDVGLLQLLIASQPMFHPHTGHKIGADVYTKNIHGYLSTQEGFDDNELDQVLLEEGYARLEVRTRQKIVTQFVYPHFF